MHPTQVHQQGSLRQDRIQIDHQEQVAQIVLTRRSNIDTADHDQALQRISKDPVAVRGQSGNAYTSAPVRYQRLAEHSN